MRRILVIVWGWTACVAINDYEAVIELYNDKSAIIFGETKPAHISSTAEFGIAINSTGVSVNSDLHVSNALMLGPSQMNVQAILNSLLDENAMLRTNVHSFNQTILNQLDEIAMLRTHVQSFNKTVLNQLNEIATLRTPAQSFNQTVLNQQLLDEIATLRTNVHSFNQTVLNQLDETATAALLQSDIADLQRSVLGLCATRPITLTRPDGSATSDGTMDCRDGAYTDPADDQTRCETDAVGRLRAVRLSHPCASAFIGVLNGGGTNACPAGSSPVTAAQCAAYAGSVGVSYSGTTSSSGAPQGCLFYVSSDTYYFNTHSTGGSGSDFQPLCGKSPTTGPFYGPYAAALVDGTSASTTSSDWHAVDPCATSPYTCAFV